MDLKKEIRKFIIENFILEKDKYLSDRDSLLENGVIDSTGVLELVAYIEENYQISVKDEELIPENLDSIRNIAEFIERKTQNVEEARILKSLSHSGSPE
jgi:acyl carrier protein